MQPYKAKICNTEVAEDKPTARKEPKRRRKSQRFVQTYEPNKNTKL